MSAFVGSSKDLKDLKESPEKNPANPARFDPHARTVCTHTSSSSSLLTSNLVKSDEATDWAAIGMPGGTGPAGLTWVASAVEAARSWQH